MQLFRCFLYLLSAAWVLSAGLYDVAVESSSRKTANGQTVSYQLYYPVSPALNQKLPAVVLTHGFGRNPSFHENNARYLAARGIVVMTPEMTPLFGTDGQDRNIANTVDHVTWLGERTRTQGDVLFGLLDLNKIALAGHSAGGAVSFEAAVEAQRTHVMIGALVLLDAVPWERTIESAKSLRRIPLSSLRSDPSLCNAMSSVRELLPALTFSTADVHVIGATHCDPENPTNFLCRLVCGGTGARQRTIYQELLYLFLRDTYSVPEVGDDTRTYLQALAGLQATGRVKVTRITRSTESSSAAP